MTTPDSTGAASSYHDYLQRLPLFAGLANDDIARLAAVAKYRRVPAGELVMTEGHRGDGLHVVLRGELAVIRRDGVGEILVAIVGPGTFVGEMSLVDDAPRSATVRAREETELLVIEPEEFQRLIASNPSTGLTIMRTIMARLRSTEAALQQHARMASLGTLAAGLAHELNNPASAVRSSVDHLRRAIVRWESESERIQATGLRPTELRDGVPTCDSSAKPTRAEEGGDSGIAEDRLSEWLAGRGLRLSPVTVAALASCGWTTEALEGYLSRVAPSSRSTLLDWVGARAEALSILDEIARAADALTALVRAVKGHTFLGAAPSGPVDVRQTLENTLTVMRGRLRNGVRVIRRIDPALPRVEGNGGELGQLWTNLIDNAIAAMGPEGTLEIDARADGDRVMVEIADTGPGIPAEVQHRVFDPFFTTKPPGAGTGLGLHIAYTIVRKHGGRISVTSKPGRTVFRVELPAGTTSGSG